MGHRFHQDHGDSFALAGHDDKVGVAVVSGQIVVAQVSDEVDAVFEAELHDPAFESRPLGALASDPAEEVKASFA